MDEYICFPVTREEKKRFIRMCRSLGIKSEEWFRRALIETEINITIRDYPDPDLPTEHTSNPDGHNPNDPGDPKDPG